MKNLIKRQFDILRTNLIWKLRLKHLGKRTTLGRSRNCDNPKAISIGSYTSISKGWLLSDQQPTKTKENCPKISIGQKCTILHDFQCNAAQSVSIGNHVLIAPRVFISDSDHIVSEGTSTVEQKKLNSNPVNIGDNCWLGINSVILKGVTLGHHCIVGSNSVVTKSAPPFSILAGSPAKIIGSSKR